MRYPLPADTAEILRARVGNNRNLGLALDRYLGIEDEKEETSNNAWGDEWSIIGETKKRHNIPSLSNPPIPTLIARLRQRSQSVLADFRQRQFTTLQFDLATDYRLVVGFGAEHVLETSICLHRIYGFPIIPGSSIKGITRAWAFWELAEKLAVPRVGHEEATARKTRDEKTPLEKLDELLVAGKTEEQERALRALKMDAMCASLKSLQSLDLNSWQGIAQRFYAAFGTTDRAGRVVFFDAYPVAAPELETDILNPHYGEYYQDKTKPPADYYNPIPTFFLTVAKESKFQFAVASKEPELAQAAETWLKRALAELGIGGKTAAGYGFWNL